MKHPKLVYGFMMVLGIIFLTTFFAVDYWYSMNIGILKMQVFEQYMGYWFCLFVVGGAVLLIVGVLRTDIPSIKKFRGYIAISIPVIVLFLLFSASMYAFNQSFFNSFAVRSEITQVTVVSTSPLVLTLDVKAITDYDSAIDGAVIHNNNDVVVAEYYRGMVGGSYQPLGELMAGSTRTLTLNFSCTIPSGNYTVMLYGNDINHGRSPFTIP